MTSLAKLLYCFLSAVALNVAATKQPTLPIRTCVTTVAIALDASETTSFRFNCQLAAFGAYLPEKTEMMKVMLAPGDKMLGCSSSFGDEAHSKFVGAAVIVRRGECSFQDKLIHVAASGAALMILVNSEETLVPLSSLEYEHSPASAVSVTKSDGDRLIQLVQRMQTDELSDVEMTVAIPLALVSQARARLQFLADINAPLMVYEEYLDIAEQLEPLVGTMDKLLSRILAGRYENPDTFLGVAKTKELVEFFSWSGKQLAKRESASQAALYATVAAAVLQIQLWANKGKVNYKNRHFLLAAAQRLTEAGYYSHSVSLLQILLEYSDTQDETFVRCRLSFLKFLQGDLIPSLSEVTGCKASDLISDIPSLQVAHETFVRLTMLKMSAHDRDCLGIARGSVNDTKLALTCCYLVEDSSKSTEYKGSLTRKFSSAFTEELFHSLVVMGVFLDELGPFDESLRFFNYALHLCEGDKTTLELRRLLAVPVVFSSQNEMDLFLADLTGKLHTYTKTIAHHLEERVISPLGGTDNPEGKSIASRLELRPEAAAYLQYTITPPTMFIGYQGVDVLSIQRAVNHLRTSAYTSLTSPFEPRYTKRSEGNRLGSGHKLRRIGFISAWFRVHSVGKLLLGVVQNLDRTKFHVTIYRCVHFLRDSDEMTESFKRAADEYVDLPTSQDAAVQALRRAQLDVAIFPELGMNEWTVLLSHHRVAPIQCVFWGHPITTGNPHIDFFISSEHFVSERFDDDESSDEKLKLSGYRRFSFSEQIVLFRGLSTIFTEPKQLTVESKGITRTRLYLPTNRRLYVCPQTLMKLHPAFDEALAGILEHDDKATIVLLASDTQIVWMEKLRRRFRQRFGRNHRRVMVLPTLPFAKFQALLALSDIVLDPFPFGGGVTTLDTLQLGIPVVTLPAAQNVVHLAAGFLRYMNASDCVAGSLDEYVQLAVTIAANPEEIRQRLLSHRSDIYQDKSTIDDWNSFLNTVTPRKLNETSP